MQFKGAVPLDGARLGRLFQVRPLGKKGLVLLEGHPGAPQHKIGLKTLYRRILPLCPLRTLVFTLEAESGLSLLYI